MTASDTLDMYDRSAAQIGERMKSGERRYGTRLDCSGRWMRNLLIGLNVFYLLWGIVLLAYGAWNYQQSFNQVGGEAWTQMLIAAGVLIFLFSLVGLLAAKYESRVLLFIYIISFIAMFLMTLIGGAIMLSRKGNQAPFVQSGWSSASSALQASIENTYQCCGMNSVTDSYCVFNPNWPPNNQTCLPLLTATLDKYYYAAAVVCTLVAVLMLASIAISWKLFKSINVATARVELRD